MKELFLGICVAFAVIVAAPQSVRADAQTDVLGVWLNQEKDAKIEMFRCGERYCGKIVWLKEPNYPEGSKDGVPGTPKLDHKNPDPALRKQPVIELVVVRDFEYAGEDHWKNGKVYDPKNGKTYRGKMRLVSPAQLDLRGYIGISLIGRTATWTRPEDKR
jgi:uncharacterized protein (DUF2147 family)